MLFSASHFTPPISVYHTRMFRRALTVLLIFVISLQSYVAVASVGMHGSETGLEHLMDHDKRVAHHHDQDGSVEHDNSDASKQHLTQHSCPAFAVIMSSMMLPCVSWITRAVAIPETPPLAQAALDDLFRPPRSFG